MSDCDLQITCICSHLNPRPCGDCLLVAIEDSPATITPEDATILGDDRAEYRLPQSFAPHSGTQNNRTRRSR